MKGWESLCGSFASQRYFIKMIWVTGKPGKSFHEVAKPRLQVLSIQHCSVKPRR